MPLKILFKNYNFIVIDKEYDLVINSCDPDRHSLQKQLSKEFPEEIKKEVKFGFYFPHRLDFSTSGVICIALNKKACATASLAFQSQASQKFYLAIVRGHIAQSYMEINVPIGDAVDQISENETSEKPLRRMCHDEANGRQAISRLVVLEKGWYNTDPATKVLLRPLTGRRHQLRVHCCHIGHTIVGDYTYSNRMDKDPPRMFLHSYRLILPNELTDLDVTTEDPFIETNVKNWTVSETNRNIADAIFLLSQQDVWDNR